MGLFKDLFSKESTTKIKQGVIQAAKQGVINAIMSQGGLENDVTPSFSNNGLMRSTETKPISEKSMINRSGYETKVIKELNRKLEHENINPTANEPYDDAYTSQLSFQLPDWGYQDFINERSIFQKGIGNIFNEPAWFYFKIFFEFNNPYGLFGHCMYSDVNKNWKNLNNCAYKYLNYLLTPNDRYVTDHIKDRINALERFTNILKYVSTNASWFFKSIKNLNTNTGINKDEYTKEKSITIECNPDAIDMRLQSLLNLYKYACYDDINQVEIIPENLRKFNMSIVVFQSPIKALHTAVQTKSGKYDYKTINPESDTTKGWNNVMSYHIYHLYNCEISKETFTTIMNSDLNNEKPFNITPSIKITFDRLYEHTMNDIYGAMWGTDGFYYGNSLDNTSNTTTTKKRLEALSKAMSKPNGKELIEVSDTITHNIHGKSSILTNFATDLLTKTVFNTSLSKDYELGTLYGDIGPGSEYFKEKMDRLRNGSLGSQNNGGATTLFEAQQRMNSFDLMSYKNNLTTSWSNKLGKTLKLK